MPTRIARGPCDIDDHRIERIEDEVAIGDELMVMVTDIDPTGKVRLSRQAVLEDWAWSAQKVWAVVPRHRILTPKVRAFLDMLEANFTPVPPWERPAPGVV